MIQAPFALFCFPHFISLDVGDGGVFGEGEGMSVELKADLMAVDLGRGSVTSTTGSLAAMPV